MGLKFNEGETKNDRLDRFARFATLGPFRCASNDILHGPYAAASVTIKEAQPMLSYTAALAFLVKAPIASSGFGTASNSGFGRVTAPGKTAGSDKYGFWDVPGNYSPRINKVGDSARKVYIADGARYSNSGTQPDVDLDFFASFGGAFADQGAASAFSNSWNRGMVPGNNKGGTWDARVWWARHTTSPKKGARGGTYRFDCGFFDGHVETLDDLEGTNPTFWYPKGTVVHNIGSELWNDTRARFGLPNSGDYTVP